MCHDRPLIELLEGERSEGPLWAAPTPTIPATRRRLGQSVRASPPSLEAWLPVRDRVLGELAACAMSRRALAIELGIALSTLKSVLLPHCRAPGAANLAKLRRWLEHRPAPVPPGGSAAPLRNGEATPLNTSAKPTSPTAYRLTVAQRERLAGYRELDERAMRKAAGVTAEVVADAVAGRSLAPELVGRLVGFLEQQQPAAE